MKILPLGSGQVITKNPESGAEDLMPLAPYGGITVTVDVIEPYGTTVYELKETPFILFIRMIMYTYFLAFATTVVLTLAESYISRLTCIFPLIGAP